MQTRVSLAVIHINLTAIPSKSSGTNAFKAIDAVHTAGIVFARQRGTFIYLVLTISTIEPWGTLAGVALGGVTAGPPMPARLILASLCRHLTMRAVPAFGTLTAIAARAIVLEIEENTIIITQAKGVFLLFCMLH
jgi:hypothetical protein